MQSHRASCLLLVSVGSALLSCASTPAPSAAEPPPSDPPVSEAPVSEAPVSEAPSAEQPPAPAPPASESPAGEAPPAPGRLAFTKCDPANRPQVCTREYRAVCGEVDTGVRCVKAPCPSTQQKTFGNACTACADAKTTGYWPVACEKLNAADTSAPAP
jgi:hypothetical protein